MNKVLLTNIEEPNEKELGLLMHEVAIEAKEKANETKFVLAEKIKLLIQNLTIKNA
jgi:hypothetical protein